MKALARVAHEPGALEMCSIPDPDPGPGEVVIAVTAAGLCGSDLEAYPQRLASTTPLPRVPGHEFSGRIVALGVGVEGWSVGDHVVSETAAYVCGTCALCRSGQYNLCPWRRGFGFGVDGAFAPYVRVPVRCLHRVPASLPLHLAALTEPTCVTYNAVVAKAVRLQGAFSHAWPMWERCLQLLAAGTIQLAPIVSDDLPLSQWQDGYARSESREAVKVIFRPHAES